MMSNTEILTLRIPEENTQIHFVFLTTFVHFQSNENPRRPDICGNINESCRSIFSRHKRRLY